MCVLVICEGAEERQVQCESEKVLGLCFGVCVCVMCSVSREKVETLISWHEMSGRTDEVSEGAVGVSLRNFHMAVKCLPHLLNR